MIVAFVAKKFIIDMVLMGPQSPTFRPTAGCASYRTGCSATTPVYQPYQTEYGEYGARRAVQPAYAGVDGDGRRTGGSLPAVGNLALRGSGPDQLRTLQSRMFVFYVSVCFFCGLLFGYFLIVPLSINFFAGYQASADITNMIDVRSYPDYRTDRVGGVRRSVPTAVADLLPDADGYRDGRFPTKIPPTCDHPADHRFGGNHAARPVQPGAGNSAALFAVRAEYIPRPPCRTEKKAKEEAANGFIRWTCRREDLEE